MIFSSKNEAKFAIESHCFRRGMMVRFYKNDKRRLRACCRNEGCGWLIHVSPMQNDKAWQIKTYVPDHSNCYWNYNNKSLRSNWIGKTFMKKFKENPKLGTNEFRQEICTTLKANVSRTQAYRAKRKALKAIEGSHEEQFKSIRNYCEELKRADPNASVILKLTEDGEGHRFQRLYICFSACKEGFKTQCRPVVGVDGCHLKGNRGGQILAAVGLDPNNNIFPISYAVVEGETKDTWMWFLDLLDDDLGISEFQYHWTFMSDKQKGLIPAFETLFPDADNRFCVRHLHTNMKRDGFGGVAIKNALWAAAKATRIEEFGRRMEDLKNIDEDAYNWLVKKPPHNWTRSHFSPYPKCDILLNNMCECFNSFILDAREKPIIPMLESIRNLLMARFQINREKAMKWESNICPKIKAIVMKNMKLAGECIPMQADEWNFQIIGPFDQHTVNMQEKTCSCRRWDLSGIPCKHAISAIWCKHEDPEQYVATYYLVETYQKCYEGTIFPINGLDLWPICTLPPPLPPQWKVEKGRPQRLRKREPDEPPAASATKLKGSKRVNKCRKCREPGHNSRKCEKTNQGEQVHEKVGEQVHEEVGEQGHVAETQESSALDPVSGPTSRSKLQVRRPSSKMGVHIGGKSNTISSVNITQAPRLHSDVVVKGGFNFISVSKWKSVIGSQSTTSTSAPASKGPLKPASKGPSKPASKAP